MRSDRPIPPRLLFPYERRRLCIDDEDLDDEQARRIGGESWGRPSRPLRLEAPRPTGTTDRFRPRPT
jgi:hypothetical protein